MNKFERRIPKVSVVIPNWFEKNQHGRYSKNETIIFAWQCIKRMIECTTNRGEVEYILIDNGSTVDMEITGYGESVSIWDMADIVIRNPKNLGFGPACNQAFGVARGEYILCVNNDIWVFENWIEDMLEAFEHIEINPSVGMVMPNLIKSQFQKDCLTEKGRLDMNKVMNLKKEDVVLRNVGVYEKGAEFGSCWMMKKELMDKIKQKDGFIFDEQFLCGMSEDRDLYKRVRLLGFETYRTNLTRVGHIGNLTISKISDRKQYTEANREKLKKKWNLIKKINK